MEHVDLHGIQIAYTRAGSGPAVVIVHGVSTDSRTWEWRIPVSRDYRQLSGRAGFGPVADDT